VRATGRQRVTQTDGEGKRGGEEERMFIHVLFLISVYVHL